MKKLIPLILLATISTAAAVEYPQKSELTGRYQIIVLDKITLYKIDTHTGKTWFCLLGAGAKWAPIDN